MSFGKQKIGLGSVQWGLKYGVSNTSGKTPDAEITSILKRAPVCGVKTIDTAFLYGDAETKLGQHELGNFQVVSKTPHCTSIIDTKTAYNFLNISIHQSLINLKIPKLYGYLVHNAGDLLGPHGPHICKALHQLKERGLVEKVGVSVYTKEQLELITAFFKPDLIQVPINVMDQRLIKNGTLKKMKDIGVEIHARSVYLQGLLLVPLSKVPAYFRPFIPILNDWHNRVRELHISPAQAAIAFVSNIAEIDQVIVGIENMQQFEDAVRFCQDPPLFDPTGLDCNDTAFIDPSLWNFK